MKLIQLMKNQCDCCAPIDWWIQITLQPVDQLLSLVAECAKMNMFIVMLLLKTIDLRRYHVEDQPDLKTLNWRRWMLHPIKPVN